VHTLNVGGQSRTYRAYRPAGLTHLAPLVVMLHGGLGSAWLAENAYGWDREADAHGFVVIYPNALGQAWNVGGGCCGVAAGARVDDVGFVDKAITDLRAQVSIDPKRMYATGMSNGAMLAYRLACDTDTFAAIAPVAGTMLGDCPNPAPISVMHVHGTADTTVPYDGQSGAAVAAFTGVSIPDLVARWRGVDRCGGPVLHTTGTVTVAEAGCTNNATVELVTIEGGGHAWPGVARSGPLDASPSPTTSATTPATTSASGPGSPTSTASETGAAWFNATDQIWSFFDAHTR
jgi:polyhydroxybutyrate depolymerase